MKTDSKTKTADMQMLHPTSCLDFFFSLKFISDQSKKIKNMSASIEHRNINRLTTQALFPYKTKLKVISWLVLTYIKVIAYTK